MHAGRGKAMPRRAYRKSLVDLAARSRPPATYEFRAALGLTIPPSVLERADQVIK